MKEVQRLDKLVQRKSNCHDKENIDEESDLSNIQKKRDLLKEIESLNVISKEIERPKA